MGFRNSLILVGLILLLGSWYFGTWAIVVGAPLVFLGLIFKFLDVS